MTRTKQTETMPSDEQEPDIHQRLPEAAGLSSDNGRAMRLVNRILHPASQHEAATALHDLLHLIGWNDEADERHMVALCASIQTALYFEGWEKGMRQLIAAIHQDDRRRGAEQRREEHAEET